MDLSLKTDVLKGMETIPLDNKQREHLLEMADVLFLSKELQWLLYEEGLLYWGNGNPLIDDEDDVNKIHWFELCIMHVAPRLYAHMYKNDQRTVAVNMSSFYRNLLEYHIDRINPVDYLYRDYRKWQIQST